MVRTRYWLTSRVSRLFALSMACTTVVNATSQRDAGLLPVPSVIARLWIMVKGLRRSGVIRVAVGAVGIMAALALQPEPGRPVGGTSVRVRVLLRSEEHTS